MSTLRRFRVLFATFAILFSPGGLTPWLQMEHACRAEAAGPQVMAGMDHRASHGQHHAVPADSDPDGSQPQPHHCVCVGMCAAAALVLPPTQLTIAVIPAEVLAADPAPVVTRLVEAPQYSHPYAQAPPLV